jgi:hypothetical protein
MTVKKPRRPPRKGKAPRAFDAALLPRDYRDMLKELVAAKVDFVIVGAWALAAHGYLRGTKDIDVFVRATPENAPRVIEAIERFGAPLFGATVDDFAKPGVILQLGVVNRIDLTTAIDGVTFDEAVEDPKRIEVDGLSIRAIGRNALMKNKRASGRPQDLLDVKQLEALDER